MMLGLSMLIGLIVCPQLVIIDGWIPQSVSIGQFSVTKIHAVCQTFYVSADFFSFLSTWYYLRHIQMDLLL